MRNLIQKQTADSILNRERHWRYRESTKPLLAFFEKLRLDAVSMAPVEKFKVTRSNDVAPATVNRDLAALRLILNLAIRKEYIAKNPVKEVQFLDEGPGQMRIVSHEEQRKYIAAASPLLRDVAILIVETGMRPEEVFNIRKENVHFEPPYLFVPIGKTRFARRNIQLTDASIEILRRRLAEAEGASCFHARATAISHSPPFASTSFGFANGKDGLSVPALRFSPHVRIAYRNGGGGPPNSQGVDGTRRYFHHDALCAPDTGTQARGRTKARGLQPESGVCPLRACFGVPTEVPTIGQQRSGTGA